MTKYICFCLLVLCTFPFLGQNIDSLKHVINSSKDGTAKSEAYKAITKYYQQHDIVLFTKYLSEGLAHARTSNDQKTEIELGFIQCRKWYASGEYRKVIQGLDSLIPKAKQLGLTELQTNMLNYSGNAYSNLSDYTNAIVQFIEYLTLAQQLTDNARPVAMASNNIGMAFLNMERYDQAIPYLENSLKFQQNFDSGFKAHTYWNLGICYMEKLQYDKALEIFRLGVAEAERSGDNYAAAGNQLCIGSIYVRQDLFQQGIDAYTSAYKMSTEANLEPYKVIEALNGLIFAYNQVTRPKEAFKYVRIADSITEHHRLSDLRNREFLFQKGSNLLLLGKPKEADLVFSRYSRAVDSLHNAENLEIIQTKETEFRTKEKEQMLELQEAELDFQRLLTTLLGVGALLLAFIGFLVYRQQRLKIKHQKQEQELNEALLTVETNRKLEEQRQRIARELHDNIGSQLTYLASAAQNIGSKMPKVSAEVTRNKLADLSDFSQEAITDLRDTIWVMNRNLITWEDLSERIRYLAHKVSNTTGIQVSVVMEGDDDTPLDPEQTMDLFRIVQEAVNNAVKHSEASTIEIRIDANPPAVVEITDNGKGFEPTGQTNNSNGLKNMRLRAQKLGADIEISSSKEGTKIRLQLPNSLNHI
jgi:signal transduction histidine kinase/Tfp pilus assembly protein PilF